ncbi:hypothetical protein [Streptomyces sp. NPDC006645]|uniref:hypothetical protein n=1 Tax=unclassified Streptomyces TaxID=2593676 RepID=UPI0033A3DE8D
MNPNPNLELELELELNLERRRQRRFAYAVAVCLAALLTTGCDTSGDGSDDARDPKPCPPSGTAKDLSTCEDGDCTVEVREGDVIPFGEGVRAPDLYIDAIGPAGVVLRLAGDGTTSTFSARSPDRGAGVSTYNGTDFRVLEIKDDTAVLRIKPNGL